jgi:catechol 2,3-dioxygenase-like lactoylglutathione lyase family enzyme
MIEESMLRSMSTAAKPLVSSVSVVYLYVRDMERSRTFYRDLLGIPLEGDEHWQEATLGGTRFALHEAHEGTGELSSGTISVSLEVADADAAAEQLKAAAVETLETRGVAWGTAIDFVDPDGYTISLFQPPS